MIILSVWMTEINNKPVTCPICNENDSVQAFQPFCSERCANVDLHRWLEGHYSVPVIEPPDHFLEDEGTFSEIH